MPPLGPVLAIDLGGTRIRAAYVTPKREVRARRETATNDEEGVPAVVERLIRLAEETLAEARAADLPEPLGAGIASPGPLDPWRGVVVAPPNLRGWRNVPLADAVEERLGLPTYLERDTNVAVIAEWRHGAGAGRANVIYVTVSTGIGGGVVVDGRLLLGPDGTAGEVGHLTVELDGPPCGDGSPGHAEAIGSGTGIARGGRELLERGGSGSLAALVHGSPEAVTAELVARAADEGDPACAAIMERAYEAVGAMCASLVNVLNPQVIVIGGSIAEHRPRLLEVAGTAIERRAFAVPARRAEIAVPRFGEDVSLIGALPIVNERRLDPAYDRRSPVGAAEERT